ncbi:MAG: PilW family protein [Pseudomonadota bacterium]
MSMRLRRDAGFTLIELMVGLALGMLVMTALTALLINVNRNNGELARNTSIIENGRFTMQLLEQDLSHAGYWGGFVPAFDDLSYPAPGRTYKSDAPNAAPDPCLSYSTTNWTTMTSSSTSVGYIQRLVGMPIQVYAVDSSGTAPTIGTCGSTWLQNLQPNTHVVFVAHAAPCTVGSSSDEDCTAEAGALYFQYGNCTDSSSGYFTVFPYYMLAAASDASLSNFTQRNRGCSAGATARGTGKNDLAPAYKLSWHVYFVRNYSVASGDGVPTLMRRSFKLVGTSMAWAGAEALIEGIEGFRVELGIDAKNRAGTAVALTDFADIVNWADAADRKNPTNRGDGNPDTFTQCGTGGCTTLQLANATAVKLYVLVRANTVTPSFRDGKTYTLGDTGGGGVCLLGSAATGTGCTALATPGNCQAGTVNTCDYRRHLYTRAVRLTNISMRRELAS